MRSSNVVARGSAGVVAALSLLAGLTACDGGPEPAPVIRQPQPSEPASDAPDAEAVPSTAETTALADPTVSAELATGLGVPWGMALLPDGSLIVTERETAEVKRVSDGTVEVIGVVEDAIAAGGEGGLLGVAVPPDFTNEPRLYLYYTSPNDNRVVSVAYGEDGLQGTEEVLTGIPKANIHNGGRIKFGPDGYLYIGTGDASVAESAQDRTSLGGKILRVTDDGAPAPLVPRESHWSMIRRGFWVNLLNPKAIVFFLAFIPQFVRLDQPPLPQYLTLIATVIVVDVLVMWGFFAAAARPFRRLTRTVRGQRILNTVFGILFIAVAALLLLLH